MTGEQAQKQFEAWWEQNGKQFEADACHMSEFYMVASVAYGAGVQAGIKQGSESTSQLIILYEWLEEMHRLTGYPVTFSSSAKHPMFPLVFRVKTAWPYKHGADYHFQRIIEMPDLMNHLELRGLLNRIKDEVLHVQDKVRAMYRIDTTTRGGLTHE